MTRPAIVVDRYLRRIRYEGPTAPTAAVLAALQVAHLRSVPFETHSIHRREGIDLDEGALCEKVVERGRGGFCYELNGLFAGLLRRLGYGVDLLSARVARDDGTYSPEFDHLALLVRPPEATETAYLADVGFGDAFLRPLRLDAGVGQSDGAKAFELLEASGTWTLHELPAPGKREPVYRFTLRPYPLDAFRAMCHFHEHSPESHFAKKPVCTLATPAGRVTLSGGRLIRTEGGERTEREVPPAERDAVLADTFGVSFGPR